MSKRRIHNVDTNQAEIVQGLRKVGASVLSLADVGKGCPDILVGYRHRNFLMEVKNPKGKNILGDDQKRWMHAWNGQVEVVRSLEEALILIGVKYKPVQIGERKDNGNRD